MTGSWANIDLDFYVVNLKKSQRRRLQMERQLSARRIRHRFIEAFDGDDVAAVRAAFVCDAGFVPRFYAAREHPVTSRELACTLSHLRAIRLAHEMSLRHVLILEDDLEIGDVSAEEIAGILAAAPPDAAYIQLCISPARTVQALAERHMDTQQLFARKKVDEPTLFADAALVNFSCHATAAYIVTARGMQKICDEFFVGTVARFPCEEEQILHNVGLVADRFIFQAAATERHPGYVYCIPTFLLEGTDSLLHQEHVAGHLEARTTAEKCRRMIMSKR